MKKLFNKVILGSDSHEFKPVLSEIEERPVNPIGRVVFWVIVSLFFLAILWLFIGKVDVVVSARGKVIPEGNIKIIQSLDAGVIRKILVKEGVLVHKGDMLMEIDPSTTEPELASLKQSLGQYELEINRLMSLVGNRKFRAGNKDYGKDILKVQNEAYKATYKSLKEQLAGKKAELKQIDEKINGLTAQKKYAGQALATFQEKEARLKPVLDIIPKDEYAQVLDNIQKTEAQIHDFSSQLAEQKQAQNQLKKEISYIYEKFKSDTLTLLAQKQLEYSQLKAKIQETSFRNRQQNIVSPVNGYVVTIEAHTIGGVVTPAQKLISIVPLDTKVKIQAFVKSTDSGFVKKEMPVTLKIDAFDFQKYGTLKGQVGYVAKNSMDNEKMGTVYEVFVRPLEKELRVEGKMETLTPGMTVTVEIKVGKRRIIEFFIYPLVKYWGEGISVR